jgi:putative oxidoreductase
VTTRNVLLLPALDRHAEIGTVILRLFFGFTLVYGTQDNVLHQEHMLKFRDFVAQNGFPYPMFSAYLSAYAQFISGFVIACGALTRLSSIVMIINFTVALLMVHVGLPFGSNISPLAMPFCAVFFLIHGPGPWSVDNRRR